MYISRKNGGRDLIVIEDYVELAVRGLEVYIHGSEGRLIQVVRGDRVDDRLEAANVLKKAKKEKRLQDWPVYMASTWDKLKK